MVDRKKKDKPTKRQMANAFRMVANYWDGKGWDWLQPIDVVKQCREIARNLEHGAPL